MSPSSPSFVLSESDKSARQEDALQVRGERWLAVFTCPLQPCLERENCFWSHAPGTLCASGVQGGIANTPAPEAITGRA